MKAVVDTNIIIDAMTSREPFREASEQVLMIAANQRAEMYITANSVTDIFYLLHKHFHDNEKTRTVIGKLFTLFSIADVTAIDCIDALQSDISDYEDAVLERCAAHIGADCIVTRNAKDFAQGNVETLSPKSFIDRLANE